MFKYLVRILLLFPLLISAQEQFESGKIVYKIKYIGQQEFESSPNKSQNQAEESGKNNLAHLYHQIHQAIPYTSFELTFNKNAAIFKLTPSMTIDQGIRPDLVASAAGGKGVFYTNLSENLIIHQRELLELTKIISSIDDLEWKIENEFKTIGGYNTQKATTEIYINPSNANSEITVWFAKDIPISFGPIGLAGLPGMILGLERGDYFYYAKEIEYSKRNKNITPPKKGKEISFKEYKELILKIHKDPLRYLHPNKNN